ncbi:MAG: hypothetical protein ACREYA_25225 [Cupriavidus necator]
MQRGWRKGAHWIAKAQLRMEAMQRLEAELTALRAALEESRAGRAVAQCRAEWAEAEAALAGQLLGGPRQVGEGSGQQAGAASIP